MECPNCSSEVGYGCLFCSNCGIEVQQVSKASPEGPALGWAEKARDPGSGRERRTRRWVAVVGVLIGAVSGGVLLGTHTRRPPPKPLPRAQMRPNPIPCSTLPFGYRLVCRAEGDFDLDGTTELAFAARKAGSATWCIQDEGKLVWRKSDTCEGVAGVQSADFTGDGRPDLLLWNHPAAQGGLCLLTAIVRTRSSYRSVLDRSCFYYAMANDGDRPVLLTYDRVGDQQPPGDGWYWFGDLYSYHSERMVRFSRRRTQGAYGLGEEAKVVEDLATSPVRYVEPSPTPAPEGVYSFEPAQARPAVEILSHCRLYRDHGWRIEGIARNNTLFDIPYAEVTSTEYDYEGNQIDGNSTSIRDWKRGNRWKFEVHCGDTTGEYNLDISWRP